MVRPGLADRLIVLFTGIPFDSLRDIRGLDWGRPMLAKKPKRGAFTTVDSKVEWVVVIQVYRDRSGVVKVYNIEIKRLAHRVKLVHARIPDRDITTLQNLDPDAEIGSEQDGPTDEELVEEENIDAEVILPESAELNRAIARLEEHVSDDQARQTNFDTYSEHTRGDQVGTYAYELISKQTKKLLYRHFEVGAIHRGSVVSAA
jgi:hypothetical protein